MKKKKLENLTYILHAQYSSLTCEKKLKAGNSTHCFWTKSRNLGKICAFSFFVSCTMRRAPGSENCAKRGRSRNLVFPF